MGPTGGEAEALPGAGMGRISAIAITLHDAAEAGGDDVIKAGGRAADSPMEERFSAGTFAGPEITLPGAAVAGALTRSSPECGIENFYLLISTKAESNSPPTSTTLSHRLQRWLQHMGSKGWAGRWRV